MSDERQLIFPNKYFEDEVRDGFFVPALIKQEWAAGLEILHAIDHVCEKHGITYFADWGTLLATVRHQGYIPWDDDLDIAMKREDYNRFLEIAPKELPEGYEIHNFQTHEDHWLFLARVVNKGRICFEEEHLRKFHQFPYIVSVDIFVLDYVCADEEQEEKRNQEALFTIALADGISEGQYSAEVTEEGLRRVEHFSGRQIDRQLQGDMLRRRLYGIAQEIFARFPEEQSNELTQLFPFGLKNNSFRFPKEYYEKTIRLPYENTTIPVPLCYGAALKKRYGSYITPVKTWDAHEYPYFQEQIDSLKKVLDFQMPEYTFSENQLRSHMVKHQAEPVVTPYKELCRECLDGAEELAQHALACIRTLNWEGAFAALQESQQLMIDLGTLIEQVKGENHVSIAALEAYCETLYRIFESVAAHVETDGSRPFAEKAFEDIANRLGEQLQTIHAVIRDTILARKEIVFLPWKGSQWDTMMPEWKKAQDNPQNDVYVVPIPYYYKNYDGSIRATAEEEFHLYPKELKLWDYHTFDLQLHHPDMIFFQNPYDNWNPSTTVSREFYSEQLQKATEQLIYVHPYRMDDFTVQEQRSYQNAKHYIAMPGVVRADRVIVPSRAMREIYIAKLTEFAGEKTRAIWEEKVVIMEASIDKQEKKQMKPKKKMAYFTHASYFVEYREEGLSKLKRVFETFEKYKDKLQVLYCVHDQLQTATELVCPQLWQEYAAFMEQYRDADWLTIIEDMDKMKDVIAEADAYYGDGGYLAMEIREAGKPVMIQEVEL